jgi:hypothetical protein
MKSECNTENAYCQIKLLSGFAKQRNFCYIDARFFLLPVQRGVEGQKINDP